MNTTMKTAVIYARYSSDLQRQESIDAQIRAITEYCQKNQILIKATYVDEAQSATTDQREQFLQMVRDTKELQVDYCIVHKLDRFSRNRYDSAFYKRELKQNGVRVVSVLEQLDDSPESIILESVLEGMSEYYSKNLAREVRKGQKENALQARHNGGTPPLGFNVTADGRYEINPVEAEAVRKIYDMYTAYYGYGKICDELNEKGYRTKRGRTFGKNSIHEILRNEKYTGCYVYNRRLSKKTGNRVLKAEDEVVRIEGAMPQIITKEQWQRAQSIMDNHRHKTRRDTSHFYLLSGKIFCAECGSAYTGSGYSPGRGGKKYFQYMCIGRKSKRCDCTNTALNTTYIEQFVLQEIKRRFTPEFIDALIREIELAIEKKTGSSHQTAAAEKELTEQIQALKMRVTKTWELYYTDVITSEQLSEQIGRLNHQLSALESQLDDMKKDPLPDFRSDEIRSKLYQILSTFENSDNESLKAIVDLFVDRIIVGKNDITLYMNLVPSNEICEKTVKNLTIAKVGGDDSPLTVTIVIPRLELYRIKPVYC